MKFHGLSEKRIVEIEKVLNQAEIPYLADRDEESITAFLSQEENSNIDPKHVIIMTLEIPDTEIPNMHPAVKQFLFKHNIIVDKEMFSDANLDIHTPDPEPQVEKYVIWTMSAIILICLLGIVFSI